ncbi:hypothetical protein FLB_09040 [Flavobacterium succinicans]|uniref:Uncharacterized protein n=1 Tax=Flavobacterium succinicans TaxID=29536 RepID=A0A199XTH1_9FLAO|nr:hypothetical protein FLB_09040 [Flavobacterium succinicans]
MNNNQHTFIFTQQIKKVNLSETIEKLPLKKLSKIRHS